MLVFIIGRCKDETSARISVILADKICGLPQSLPTREDCNSNDAMTASLHIIIIIIIIIIFI
jgi:hypothetical protein